MSHIIPSSESYILSLQENFNLIGIIPKPNSINKRTEDLLKGKDVPILSQFTRESITSNPNELSDYLDKYDNICMVDIGGYFSESIDSIKKNLGRSCLVSSKIQKMATKNTRKICQMISILSLLPAVR